MNTNSPLFQMLAGADVKMRRMVTYWGLTAVLYLLCVFLLGFEVSLGAAAPVPAAALTAIILSGLGVFYVLIRCSARLGLAPAQLSGAQAYHAIACIIGAYATVAPVRGAVLILLLVVLVFCAFALPPRKSHQMSAVTVGVLGIVMVYLSMTDPQAYPAKDEVVHFALIASMLVAVTFLTSQFNYLRERLKSQKAELAEALAQIKSIATQDELTLLPNRRKLKELMAHEERRHERESGQFCLALIDIDFFKQINDSYGHDVGDEVLCNFAYQVQLLLRTTDIVGRWGGEEFLILLPSTGQDVAVTVMERVRVGLAELHVRSINTALPVTFSCGLTVISSGETVSDAIKRADLAMFHAKADGRNAIRVFDASMELAKAAYNVLKIELQQAIRQHQLVLFYQPQVHSDGTVRGAEALVRWRHPVRGLVPPGDFIPLAEESGLIVPLGLWALADACKQLTLWQLQEDTKQLTVSVNISAKQLRHPAFVNQVQEILATTGADPCKLKLELTESMLVEDINRTVDKMKVLKTFGISFSLDDFGTGYSSLSYLTRLPIDQLKIDQSFVKDMLTDPNNATIARTVVKLGNSLGFAVIAEGVENVEQQEFLITEGCNEYQGYLYSRPLPIEEFEAFLRVRKPGEHVGQSQVIP